MNRKQRRGEAKASGGKGGAARAASDDLFAAAADHHSAGRLVQAEAAYRQALARDPRHGPSLHNLGLLAHGLGDNVVALELIGRAIALEMEPGLADAHGNRAQVLRVMGRLEEAAADLERAARLDPASVALQMELGAALHDLGRLEGAVAAFGRAAVLAPGLAVAHGSLGNVLHDLGRLEEAEANHRRALALEPQFAEVQFNLANTLRAQGRLDEALALAWSSLQLKETAAAKGLIADCLKVLKPAPDAGMRALLAQALIDPWARPGELAALAAQWVGSDPQTDDPLLIALLHAAPVQDVALERWLTSARAALLGEGQAGDLTFPAALASQGFINDYVFAVAEDEAAKVAALRAALASGAPIGPRDLLVAAAYGPLGELPGAEALLDRAWPPAVEAVLTQQVREPAQERADRANIPQMTPISGGASRQVQAQYEESPYPRWVVLPSLSPAAGLDAFLRRLLPLALLAPIDGQAGLDILVAGCGTGQQPIETAQRFPAARILAIDLSLTSLAYACRKTRALGIGAIDYAQADIMALESLERRFHLIESSGVLHHLADPFTGWRKLVGLLHPGGVMRIALYSQAARRPVALAHAFIAERGYGRSPGDVRRYRQDLMASGDPAFAPVLQSADFFATSACRDLLSHVQEHWMTLPQIAAFLDGAGLQLLGLEADPAVLQAYRRRFPDDPAAIDLANWAAFEADHPQTFAGMYPLWVQRRG